MTINILTSYIIGGLLLISLAWMNVGVNYNSKDVVLSQIKQGNKVDISEIISYDFPKIGYTDADNLDTLIISADEKSIEFYSNIDNSDDDSIERIKWEYTSETVSHTNNPNDYVLKRTQDGVVTNITLGVTGFRLRYYDNFGDPDTMATPVTGANLDNIRQIELEIILQSGDLLKYSAKSEGAYVTSAWTKRFTPRNLLPNL